MNGLWIDGPSKPVSSIVTFKKTQIVIIRITHFIFQTGSNETFISSNDVTWQTSGINAVFDRGKSLYYDRIASVRELDNFFD